MMQKRSPWLVLTLSLASLVLSSLTVVFGALPLQLLRRRLGRAVFWPVGILLTTMMFALKAYGLGIMSLCFVVLIGVYAELEKMKKSQMLASAASVFLSSLAGFGAVQIWMKLEGWSMYEKAKEQVAYIAAEVLKINDSVKLDQEAVVAQLPSAFIGVLIIALAVSLILERGFTRIAYKEKVHFASTEWLSTFRLPDAAVWIAMLSFLFSFVKTGSESVMIVSANIFNVMTVLCFLQGLAVTQKAFRVLRMSRLMRYLSYLVLVTQLFLFVAAVGFLDYWLDFRKRLTKVKPLDKGLA